MPSQKQTNKNHPKQTNKKKQYKISDFNNANMLAWSWASPKVNGP